MLKKSALWSLLLALVMASTASADVIIKLKQTDKPDSKNPSVETGSVVLGADRLAMHWDKPGESGERGFIFRGDKDLVWIVNDEDKTYTQLDKEFVDKTAAKLSEAQAQMKAQLDKMPADQRAKAEAMMKKFAGGMMDASAPVKVDYKKTGETRTINGHPCTKYESYLGDDLVAYLWVTPYSAVNLTEKDGAVFQKMGDFMAKLTGPLAKLQKQDLIPLHELGGIPILSQDLDDGKVTMETVIESVTRGDSPAGSYDVPEGYKMKKMPGMEDGD